jgi:Flp pilus assembly pilin Flp
VLYEALRCYWDGWSSHDTLIFYDGELLSRSVRIGRAVVEGAQVITRIRQLWKEESGQDVAEYAVMLAVILVIVIGTVKLIGSNANNVFSQVGSQLSQ